MEFSTDAIAQVELTCKRGKYYLVSEVDELLGRLSDSAKEKQQRLNELTAATQEYAAQKQEIAEVMLEAKKLAQDKVEREREQYKAELADLCERKKQLTGEIAALLVQKKDVLASCRQALDALSEEISRQLSAGTPDKELPVQPDNTEPVLPVFPKAHTE